MNILGRRPSPPTLELHRELVDLAAVLRETANQINWILDERIVLDLPSELPAFIDPRWIREAVWLLAETLLPHAQARTEARLRARAEHDRVLIELTINGEPFGPTELAEINQFFAWGQPTFSSLVVRLTRYKSLKLLRLIAQAHRGTARAEVVSPGLTRIELDLADG